MVHRAGLGLGAQLCPLSVRPAPRPSCLPETVLRGLEGVSEPFGGTAAGERSLGAWVLGVGSAPSREHPASNQLPRAGSMLPLTSCVTVWPSLC